MHLATWNVNSLRARLDVVLTWLETASPDILCLQETKVINDLFPQSVFEERGYTVLCHGQKSYNGVAILSRFPVEEESRQLAEEEGAEIDIQARFLQAWVYPPQRSPLCVVSAYIPNGNPVNTEKYPYKLRWLEAFERRAVALLGRCEPVFLCGDYNIIPTAQDVHDVKGWEKDALYLPEVRAWYQALLGKGYTDCVRSCTQDAGVHTFWDYQSGAWPKRQGIRIDHILASPEGVQLLEGAQVHTAPRGWEKASDHAPVSVFLT